MDSSITIKQLLDEYGVYNDIDTILNKIMIVVAAHKYAGTRPGLICNLNHTLHELVNITEMIKRTTTCRKNNVNKKNNAGTNVD